jgi:hypothetical protein
MNHRLIFVVLILGALFSCNKSRENDTENKVVVSFPELPANRIKGVDFSAYLKNVVIKGSELGRLSNDDRVSVRLIFASISSRLETLDKNDQFISTETPIWKLLMANFPDLRTNEKVVSDKKVSLINLGKVLQNLKE